MELENQLASENLSNVSLSTESSSCTLIIGSPGLGPQILYNDKCGGFMIDETLLRKYETHTLHDSVIRITEIKERIRRKSDVIPRAIKGINDMINKNVKFKRLSFMKDKNKPVPSATSKEKPVVLKDSDNNPAKMRTSDGTRDNSENRGNKKNKKEPKPHIVVKLGWIQGVLIPCLLNIWGVMLFLRISWVVSQAGIGLTLVIIAISSLVCVVTTLSLSAICTNGEVRGGGIYYLVSRSLGPEFGASVGIVFAFANAVSASMNTIGFCDSMNDLLKEEGVAIFDNGPDDTRVVGTIALILMCIICAVGMDWEAKAQNFLLVTIVVAIMDFIIGCFIGPKSKKEIARGFVGLNAKTFQINFGPAYTQGENFFSVFAIYFPSVTGIQAGANICGDLKDPATAIPKGTLLAVLISLISYLAMALLSGAGAMRDATGNLSYVINGKYVLDSINTNDTYEFGLHNSYSVMQLMAVWGPFIYAGCWAATLSTALTNLLSVPRLIAALGVDRIYPGFHFFAKPYGRAGEPYRGYVLTFFVSLLFLLIANLDVIAPLITNFFLASYALINFCTFHAALISPLGWRPTFRYYNMWLSLVGCLSCVAIMFAISWFNSIITCVLFFALYLIVQYRTPDVNWGSSAQAQTYKSALYNAHRLARTDEHVKNYWPQVLVLSGPPHLRPALVELANFITMAGSLMIIGDISEAKLTHRERADRAKRSYKWLIERKIKAFFSNVNGCSFETGAQALMQASGIGKLVPNVLLVGFMANWMTAPCQDLLSYFNILYMAYENKLAIAIMRMSYVSAIPLEETEQQKGTRAAKDDMMFTDSDLDIEANSQKLLRIRSIVKTDSTTARTNISHRDPVLTQFSVFQRKKAGVLDLWWLYNDGGLTILLPYIISQRSNWGNCSMRIFMLAKQTNTDPDEEESRMRDLLSKFRITYRSLMIVHDISKSPRQETKKLFKDVIQKFTEAPSANEGCGISAAELEALEAKTNRHLRLRELLLENSHAADLLVISAPMPRKGVVSAPLYMAWLEMLSRDLPPVLFVRGNRTSVLTFYS